MIYLIIKFVESWKAQAVLAALFAFMAIFTCCFADESGFRTVLDPEGARKTLTGFYIFATGAMTATSIATFCMKRADKRRIKLGLL